jgi:hypothetical protein
MGLYYVSSHYKEANITYNSGFTHPIFPNLFELEYFILLVILQVPIHKSITSLGNTLVVIWDFKYKKYDK